MCSWKGCVKGVCGCRFGVAACDLDNCIIAYGGFDGVQYLGSGERFDPREGIWHPVRLLDTHFTPGLALTLHHIQ